MSPALIGASNTTVISRNPNPKDIGTSSSSLASVQPRTKVEHYWAARALKAETLLSARIAHHQELRSLTSAEELKRTRALAALASANDAKLAKMEKLVLALLASVLLLVTLVAYLLSHLSFRNPPPSSRWSLPSHFTIPVLSPFTSVTEHESSVVGTRLIATFLVVLAILAYAIFRYRAAGALIMRR